MGSARQKSDSVKPVRSLTELRHWLWANMLPIDRILPTHNDFRSGNFLFDEAMQKIAAWLAWELAHLGDRHQGLGFFAVENTGHLSEDGSQILSARLVGDRRNARYIRARERIAGQPTRCRILPGVLLLACRGDHPGHLRPRGARWQDTSGPDCAGLFGLPMRLENGQDAEPAIAGQLGLPN